MVGEIQKKKLCGVNLKLEKHAKSVNDILHFRPTVRHLDDPVLVVPVQTGSPLRDTYFKVLNTWRCSQEEADTAVLYDAKTDWHREANYDVQYDADMTDWGVNV